MDKSLLERCEAEALNLSGAIQPHGTLFVVDAAGQVSHVAQNIAAFFGQRPQAWLDRPLPEPLTRLAAELGPEPGSRRVWEACVEAGPRLLDAIASRGMNGTAVFELVPHLDVPTIAPAPSSLPVEPPADESELAALRQHLVEEIAALTGFPRVMFYLFREDGDGEVVAESHDPSAYGSYLGLRFPASDIPQIARALYLKNPWRMIPDARAEPIPLVGRTAEPPDLTWSDLRSVSPVHRVYLANMGVVASLSFPVVVGGALVALVAAHHRQASLLPTFLLERASACVRSHAIAFAGYQSQRRMRLVDGLQYRFSAVTNLLRRHGGIESAWPELAAWLMREFAADGVLLIGGEDCLAAGLALEPAALEAVEAWFAATGDFVRSCDSLRREVPGFPLSAAAGLLALRIGIPGAERSWRLYLTRCEYVHEVAWGGNPEKPVEYHDGELGIAPRRPFEKWIEKRLGYSRPWDNEARLLALKLRELLQHEMRFGPH